MFLGFQMMVGEIFQPNIFLKNGCAVHQRTGIYQLAIDADRVVLRKVQILQGIARTKGIGG